MLFWIKCLLAFYDTSIIIEPLIPLYLYHTAGLDFLECAGVMAALHLLSLVGTAYWTKLIENEYYPLVMALFSIMGIISYIALFILEGWMLLIYIVLNGLFYQPLQVLMDAVVIKILGDFRVLFYASFISSSKIMGFVVLIFLSLYYYYSNNIITPFIVITCASSALVLLVSTFTRVETANSDQLDISQDQAPLLLKNARSLITENQQRYLYKPYSLFAQPLSHISEEVDEELDIVDTRESYFSFRSSVPPPQPATPPSHALCFFFTLQTKDPLAGLLVSKDEDEMTGFPVIKMKKNEERWKKQMLCLSMLCVGLGRGWVLVFLPLYHFYVLELTMSMITCLVLAYNIGEWITTVLIEKYFDRLNLILITTCVHIVFILYVLIYPYLKVIPILLLSLQFILGISFQWMWLSTSKTVNTVTDTYYERMKLRAIMSSLYTCVGPVIGVLIIGGCLDSIHDYAFLINQCLFLFVASFLISWGWSL